ncbi:MerR family transcriptional regulator [Peptacetobacter hiranonis]|uniref:Transcriptional regulator, MerR family n=1 Tax=Peptacetobacter hiranonis (strain DSM 13275 / JCM 10541 / KCTC 15199 / TO-931) TaxID=500633 RepID=B6G0Y2_PEPHT|nr:MerR family transcriptional regulator [Peptacetobacter hiranonis]EEA84557.1 transcriptional regulator, MerR family [Peptacetobacter hiranonis DSM 13275]QEK21620.1 HTH-type transcriptional activator mta [Peptacetobacter hiranonis]
MKNFRENEIIKLTVSQFAKLHNVNKRTLHYYDEIGIFSPDYKGENGYRYYDYMQGVDFEYIKMLKELNMGLDEIKRYIDNPNEEDFKEIAEVKIKEIDQEIRTLNRRREVLEDKLNKLNKCDDLRKKNSVKVIECEEQKFFYTPFKFEDDDLKQLISHIKDVWTVDEYCKGIGSFISVDKIQRGEFEEYDGLFIEMLDDMESKNTKNTIIKPKGKYICAYHMGDWDTLPDFYDEIVEYAEENNLTLVGYSFEIGMNDFAISDMEDYITQIMIRVEENNINSVK